MSKRYFEDLEVGEKATSDELLVSKNKILEFAREYDPQDFHADEAAGKDSYFGEIIAPGTFTIALWRKMDHEINGDIKFVCGFGWDEVRWPIPVRSNDRLRASSEILSKRDASNPNHGHAVYAYKAINQDDNVVLTFSSHNIVWKKPKQN